MNVTIKNEPQKTYTLMDKTGIPPGLYSFEDIHILIARDYYQASDRWMGTIVFGSNGNLFASAGSPGWDNVPLKYVGEVKLVDD